MYIKHKWVDGPRCSSAMLNHMEEEVALLSGLIDGFDSINTGGADEVGPQGDKGPIGPVGPKGKKGLPGRAGAQGPQGPDGDRGPDGEQGEVGAPGAKGTTGAKGATGAKGPVGNTGATGAKGKDFNIADTHEGLKTTAKTIDGSINELNILLGGVMYV